MSQQELSPLGLREEKAEDMMIKALFTEGSPSLARVIRFLPIRDVAQAVLAVALGRLAVSGRLGRDFLLPHMLDSVNELHFRKSSTLSVAGAASLARGCKKLWELSFSDGEFANRYSVPMVTDAILQSLAEGQGCKELRRLDLTSCALVSDAGVKSLAAGCKELRGLNLFGCKEVTDAGVKSLAAGCKELRDLNLKCCKEVTDAGVKSLADGCKELRNLDLSYCNKVTDAGVKSLADACKELRDLDIYRYAYKDVSTCIFSL